MAESLWCFEPDDRLLTMALSGEARIWTVTPDGWLVLAQGRPRQEDKSAPKEVNDDGPARRTEGVARREDHVPPVPD